MAVTLQGSVLRVTADADTFDNQAKIKITGFKLIGNATDASTAIVKDSSSSGQILWQGRVAIDVDLLEQINIRGDRKLYVELTGTGPVLYIYLE